MFSEFGIDLELLNNFVVLLDQVWHSLEKINQVSLGLCGLGCPMGNLERKKLKNFQ